MRRTMLAVLVLAAGMLALVLVKNRPAGEPTAAVPLAPWTSEPIQPLVAPALDPRKVALGHQLFEDPRLSGSAKVACSTCHDVRTNGARPGPRTAPIDTPTVFNAGENFRVGWEGRAASLEHQAGTTLQQPMMMQGIALDARLARLERDADLSRRFRALYDRSVDRAGVVDAIATYERSLVTPGSRFDRWLAGDATAIDAQERRGYARFKRLGCVSCHQGRNIGGNLLQRHGIFRPLAAPKPVVLRVPSLRNVAATGPYLHDGSAATLEIAVTRMAGAQLDVDLDRHEVADIAAFLRTLTGTYQGWPVRAPR